MQLGGMYSIRGFDEGAMLADCGYTLSFELKRSVPFLPKEIDLPYWKNKTITVPLKDKLQFATFYDQGYGKEIFQGENSNYKNFLQSIGVGLRINLTKYLTANLDLGIPLGKKRYDGQQDVRFHFSINSNILPVPFKSESL